MLTTPSRSRCTSRADHRLQSHSKAITAGLGVFWRDSTALARAELCTHNGVFASLDLTPDDAQTGCDKKHHASIQYVRHAQLLALQAVIYCATCAHARCIDGPHGMSGSARRAAQFEAPTCCELNDQPLIACLEMSIRWTRQHRPCRRADMFPSNEQRPNEFIRLPTYHVRTES